MVGNEAREGPESRSCQSLGGHGIGVRCIPTSESMVIWLRPLCDVLDKVIG